MTGVDVDISAHADIAVNEHPLYRQAKAQVDEAQRQLNHASVRAPFSGVVTSCIASVATAH